MQNWMDDDREVLARTLMAEAGNQGPLGMLAAGSVIMNRARTPGYGDGVQGVILKPGQFSTWNSVTGYAGGEQGQNMAAIRPTSEAYSVADRLLSGQYEDPTGGATHFYNPDISTPSWGQSAGGDWTRIGAHVFGRADAGRNGRGGNMQPQGLLSTSDQAQPERLPFFQRPEVQDLFDTLAIGFGGMTMNPNQALIGAVQERMGQRREQAQTAAQRNSTLDYLRSLKTPQAQEATRYAEATGDITGALRMATGGETPAAFRALQAQAEAAGLQRGTPEYQQFMLSGGAGGNGAPAAFVALDMQARAAGFVPQSEGGDGSYEDFMATRGAGLVAESRARGEARGAAIAGAPTDVATADITLQYINDVRNHPGIDIGTGVTSIGNLVPGTPGYDFQNRVDQLLSGGFLTAIDQLRGMGALSNAEGQTATRAISRMDTATSKAEFLDALEDYENIVRMGRERAAKRLPQGGQTGAATATPSSGGGTTRLRFNATTGQMEPVND